MIPREKLVDMLRLMYRIRLFEQRLTGLYDYRSYLRKGDTAACVTVWLTTAAACGAS